jgi:cyclopropane-fatty-acyl-phospholipid synthase
MTSLLYRGTVEHRRLHPNHHRLAYPLYVYALDLAELDRLDRRLPLFGYNRRRPVSLRDKDYLNGSNRSIRKKLMEVVEPHLSTTQIEQVIMVTACRYLGYIFNPVNFYYCYDAQGRLLGNVAEVNNTFGEGHVYVLAASNGGASCYPARYEIDKAFHVSPFNRVAGRYHFTFADIRQNLDIGIDLREGDRTILQARLRGQPVALSAFNHLRIVLRHPVMPHLTIPRIYREAFKLRFQRGLTYHPKPVPLSPMTIRRNPPSALQRRCRDLVIDYLERTRSGSLLLTMPDGTCRTFGGQTHPEARIRVNDNRFFSRVVFGGDIGFGEAFMEDEWDSDDVTGVVRFFIRNRDTVDDGRFRSTLISRGLEGLRYLTQRNTLWGSRRNIYRHYDLSNAFFMTFLDPSMAYSCAVFPSREATLEEAQRNKYARLIEKARLAREDHVLEIGCGWGGFAIEAVRRTGCRITGVTVSREQYRMARERVEAAGLEDRIRIKFEDYRNVQGQFDKIVSIEMLEAVGHAYFKTFFRSLERLLKPRGIVVLQTITIPDQRYESYRRERDWIQKHIFPGGLLPSLTVLTSTMTRHSRLMVEHVENIGDHYALTLAEWRRRFLAARDTVTRMGFDRRFQRKWLYYLSSCEAGFRERVLGDLQLVLTREGNPRVRQMS